MSRLKVILKNIVRHPLLFAVALLPVTNAQNLKMVGIANDFLKRQRLTGQTSGEITVAILQEKLTRGQRFLLYVCGESWLHAVRELTPWPATR
jgi:hypothetical protein